MNEKGYVKDYNTLFNAIKDLDLNVLVFAKRFNIDGLKIPDNVEIKYDVYGDEYRNYFLKSKFVVVPLQDIEVSSGLMVLLDAMLYGKALIITRAWASEDYVNHLKNGLLVSPHNSDDLKEKIQYLINHPDEVIRLRENAKKTVFENYSMLKLAQNVSTMIDSL